MRDTSVFFPLSQDLALWGRFDGGCGVIEFGPKEVGVFNSIVFRHCHRQIYAPTIRFPVFATGTRLTDGHALAQEIGLEIHRSLDE
jgi:hypothetical protein